MEGHFLSLPFLDLLPLPFIDLPLLFFDPSLPFSLTLSRPPAALTRRGGRASSFHCPSLDRFIDLLGLLPLIFSLDLLPPLQAWLTSARPCWRASSPACSSGGLSSPVRDNKPLCISTALCLVRHCLCLDLPLSFLDLCLVRHCPLHCLPLPFSLPTLSYPVRGNTPLCLSWWPKHPFPRPVWPNHFLPFHCLCLDLLLPFLDLPLPLP